MLGFILSFRLKQGLRLLDEIGFFRVLLLGFFIVPILLGFLEVLIKSSAWLSFGVIAASIVSIHLSRTDKNFLKRTQPAANLVFGMEYLLMSLPFLVLFLFKNAFLPFGILGLLIVGLPFINYTLKWKKNHPFFPSLKAFTPDFEWILGIRKYGFYLFLFWIGSLGLSYYTASVLVGILGISIIISTFYFEPSEERNFLHLYAASPKRLMHRKILRSLQWYLLMIGPLLFGFLVFHSQYWYILLVVFIIGCVIQLTSITLKYATYAPKTENKRNSFVFALLLACWLTPFLQPVPLLMTLAYYKKALSRLKYYF